MQKSVIADWVLVGVTLSWGLTFPLIEDAVRDMSPTAFVAVRFLLASLIVLPFLWSSVKKLNRPVLIGGCTLGLFYAATYIFQTIGMQTVTAARGAFITGVSVVMVPFLLPIFGMGKPSRWDVVASLMCLLGLYVLTGGRVTSLHIGDMWIFFCAIAVACSIVYLQKLTQKHSNVNAIAFLQMSVTAVIALLITPLSGYHGVFQPMALTALLFCAIVATSVALVMQTRYQRYTTASRAALIFSLEPIFGALFGYFINSEALSWRVVVGGSIIVTSILFSEFYKRWLS